MASAKIITTGCLGYIIFSDGTESTRFSSVLEGVTIIAKSLAQEKLTEKEAEILTSKIGGLPLQPIRSSSLNLN